MRAWLNRNMPVLLALGVMLMLLQFLQRHWPTSSIVQAVQATVVPALHGGFWYLAVVCCVAWLMVISVYLHHCKRAPAWIYKVIPMDVLDRLTNKRAIEVAADELERTSVVIDAQSLAIGLKASVIGQDEVCDDLAQQIRRRLALAQRNRPVAVALFAGPPGTGKTHLAKILARELERTLLHFDMTQFAAGSFATSQLFGMTKGYVGSDSYGKLTGGLRDFPKAVVLLDEIEKAHPEVMKNFLTAWNDGFVTEASDGKHISTQQAIFILTTNAATEALAQLGREYSAEPEKLRYASVNTLREHGFAAEVLSRIDHVFVFRPLAGIDVARVCALEIEALIRGYGLEIVSGGIAPEIIVDLMKRYGKLGAIASSRDVVRAIEQSIADSLIAAKQRGFGAIELRQEDGKVSARAVRRPGSEDGVRKK